MRGAGRRVSTRGRSRDEIAARVAVDLLDGWVVNLGIGMPTLVANQLPDDREVIIHSENGILGVGRAPDPALADPALINASKEPVTVVPGGAYFSHADSFAMIRGGHLDIAVLGAFEVSAAGDLANWSTATGIPAVGGAMDLAAGAMRVYAMMSHTASNGRPKLLERCSLPLTGAACVTRIYTDLAVLEPAGDAFVVREMVPGLTRAALQELTGAPLDFRVDSSSDELVAIAGIEGC